MPRIVVAQPYLSAAMQTSVEGYQYWFHRQLDYRPLDQSIGEDLNMSRPSTRHADCPSERARCYS